MSEQYSIIGSGCGLTPTMRQAIICVGMFDDLFGNNAVTVMIKTQHITLDLCF